MGLTFVVAVMIFGSFNRLGCILAKSVTSGVGCKIKFTRNKKMVGVGRRLGSWNYGESFENKDANRCVLTLFYTMFWEVKLLRILLKRGRLSVHSSAI